jgi:phage shock protein E
MMDVLKQYWPLMLLVGWFGYRWYSTYSLKKQLPELMHKGAVLVDVRSPGEYQAGHADGSINIPLDEISLRHQELPQDKPVLVACASGTRSAMARLQLKRHGFSEVYNMGNWKNLEVSP